MNYMKELLAQVKIRPSMHLGDCKLENLCALMNGYMYRMFPEEETIPEFYPGFQSYIENKYNITTGQHWSKILLFFQMIKKRH